MTPVEHIIEALDLAGCSPRRNGSGVGARCPAHEDRVASLSISEGSDGRALVHCHAGCNIADVLKALGLTLPDLMPPRAPRSDAPPEHYDYHDEQGVTLFRVVRRADKKFHQQRPDDRGGWVNNLKGVRRIPYRLPEVLAAIARGESLYIAEGEKDAETLAGLGLAATCNPGGAGKWRDDFSEVLAAAKSVRVLADNDEPGRKHAEQVAVSFAKAGATAIKMVDFSDLQHGGDVSDWLALPAHLAIDGGARRAALLARIEAAPDWSPATPTPPAKPDRRQGMAMAFTDPEPWPDPVDGVGLLDELAAVVRRYIVMPETAVVAAVLWVLMTYVIDHVPFAVRLIVSSPTRECGKTRLLTVLGALARRALSASSITSASLFRLIAAHAPTLALDEMDNARLRENDELRALLNSGHDRATAFAWRTVGDDHEPRAFSTWCAIALAAIGNLPDTLTSRAVVLRLQRKPRGEVVARLREARLRDEVAPLRRRLVRWAADHGPAIGERDPDLPGALDGRAADNASVLVAIADEAGGRWPDMARRAMVAMSGAMDDEAPAILMLADLRDLFAENKADKMSSEVILSALIAMDSRPWAEWRHGKVLTKNNLARLLRPFGVQSRTLRVADQVVRGYSADDLRDAFARYLPVPSATTLQAAPAAVQTEVFNLLHGGGCSTCENVVSPNNDAACSVVADENRSEGGSGTSRRLVDPFDLSAGRTDAELVALAEPFGWELDPDAPAFPEGDE